MIHKSVKIQGAVSAPYSIEIRRDLSELSAMLSSLTIPAKRACVVTESRVGPLYAEEVRRAAEKAGFETSVFTFEAGEEHKDLGQISALYKHLIERSFDRRDVLIALGGGVCGDMCGFAAATYLRGIDFIQVPTTLLSMVDSSVGGKTGVDLDGYKNMVGAFHQPRLVYMGVETLNT
ncbi:MAG: 3-dehydroquinate synthase, partial [Lachnospiraceae bacterium]|nr:3-dehydroquinate synthase [Lachnospiraceae bacterium]